jgi:hypothetical protein
MQRSEPLRDWVLLIGQDEASRAQLDECRRAKPPLAGVVDCRADRSADRDALCGAVGEFPSFCHVERDVCVSGARSAAEIDALVTL